MQMYRLELVQLQEKIVIGDGDKVSDGTTTLTAMTDAKNAAGAATADGVDDNDNSVITAESLFISKR